MDINKLTTAIKEIENNVKVLENSKFEEKRELIINGRQVKLTLRKSDLEKIFNSENIKSVEKFVTSDKFSKNVRIIQIEGGFVILK